jgi:hypothetical protein
MFLLKKWFARRFANLALSTVVPGIWSLRYFRNFSGLTGVVSTLGIATLADAYCGDKGAFCGLTAELCAKTRVPMLMAPSVKRMFFIVDYLYLLVLLDL